MQTQSLNPDCRIGIQNDKSYKAQVSDLHSLQNLFNLFRMIVVRGQGGITATQRAKRDKDNVKYLNQDV